MDPNQVHPAAAASSGNMTAQMISPPIPAMGATVGAARPAPPKNPNPLDALIEQLASNLVRLDVVQENTRSRVLDARQALSGMQPEPGRPHGSPPPDGSALDRLSVLVEYACILANRAEENGSLIHETLSLVS